jgi:ApaG protein
MVSQVTQGVKVSVITSFEGIYFKNQKIHYAFTYRITIVNQSKDTVQLLTRHWEIFDALNHKEVVDGAGVVGQKPVMKPGETYSYTSGCLLVAPLGTMKGFFTMINFTTSRKFDVEIPAFGLGASYILN